MLWTVMPMDVGMDEDDAPASFVEMSVGRSRLVLEHGPDGTARVHRLLSTDPADYLRPEWQPGAAWPPQGR
ncbi:MAG: YlzJ-like family protein [Limnochordales bacterium]